MSGACRAASAPTGQVIAQDIERKYLDRLRQRVSREGLDNVTLVLGEAHDPRLPPRSVDLALLVHMYHEIAQPFGLLHNLAPAMRPGGRVAILDTDGPIRSHGTPRALLLLRTRRRRLPRGGMALDRGPLGLPRRVRAAGRSLPEPERIQPCGTR